MNQAVADPESRAGEGGWEAKGVWDRDAVDTSPDLGSQNALKTFGIKVFCGWIYFHLRSKIFLSLVWRAIAPIWIRG